MPNKSELLLQRMSRIYMDASIKDNEEIRKFLFNAAQKLNLDANINDEFYPGALLILSRGISNYYFSHKKQLPDVIMDLYKEIKPDIQRFELDNKKYRGQAIGYGIIATPLIFF